MNTAVEALNAKRTSLLDEKQKMVEKYDKEITDLEIAIETLTGDKFMDIPATERFDDESPDYVKASLEEM